MTDLLIRDIEPQLKRQIEERASKNRESLSVAAQALIRRGLESPPERRKLGTEMYTMIRPEDRGDDLVFEYRGDMPKPPDFE
jgi:hypothetical protein